MPETAETIANDIRARIAGLPENARLWSVRELMSTYAVSQPTVGTALDILEQAGLIRREVGKGIFVNRTPEQRRRILMALPQWGSSRYGEMMEAFRNSFRSGKVENIVLQYPIQNNWLELIRMEAIKYDGVILEPFSADFSPKEVETLAEFPVPIVVLDRDLSAIRVASVSADDRYGGMLAARHLIEHGHERLGILITEPLVDTCERRIQGFRECCDIHGIRPEIIDCGTHAGEKPLEKAYACLRATERLDATAYFIISDASALGVMKALADRNLRVPQDISLVGFDGLSEGAFYPTPLTTIAIDMNAIAENALELLNPGTDGLRHRMVKPELLVRESVSMPKLAPTLAQATPRRIATVRKA